MSTIADLTAAEVRAVLALNDGLPRLVATDSVWPARPVVKIAGPDVCDYCTETIAYYHRPGGTGAYVHVDTELTRCSGTGPMQLATPAPTCPACGARDVTTDLTDAWADYTRCGGCGWSDRRSLGD